MNIKSNINFVFFSNSLIPNGLGLYGMEGPFFNYIKEGGQYSYTLNGEIKPGYKNVLMTEPLGTVDDVTRISTVELDKIKKLIRQGCKLLIVSLADPSSSFAFENCLEFLKNENLIDNIELKNYKNVIFLDSNVRYKDTIHTLDYFLEEGTRYKDIFYNSTNSLGYISEIIAESELDKFRNMKFISFNRNNDKIHRFYLLREYLTGKYNDSYFSFLMQITQYNDLLMVGDDVERDLVSNEMLEYNQKIPIELDTQKLTKKNEFVSYNTFKKDLFLDSCINLVTETSFINNELFISEKIFKPILSYQPFIVLGPQGYLNRLKEYGFKTFSDFWDESYDNIEDFRERLFALINLIRDLNNLSIEDMNALYQNTKDICIHNRNLFYSLELDNLKQILNNIEHEW